MFPQRETLNLRYPNANPNASQWNIVCIGSPRSRSRTGHVHFIFVVSISFALGSQFPVEYGLNSLSKLQENGSFHRSVWQGLMLKCPDYLIREWLQWGLNPQPPDYQALYHQTTLTPKLIHILIRTTSHDAFRIHRSTRYLCHTSGGNMTVYFSKNVLGSDFPVKYNYVDLHTCPSLSLRPIALGTCPLMGVSLCIKGFL